MHGRRWVKAVVVAMVLGVSAAAHADGWRGARDWHAGGNWQAGGRVVHGEADRGWHRDWREHRGRYGYRRFDRRGWHRWHDRGATVLEVRPYGFWWGGGGPVIIYRRGR